MNEKAQAELDEAKSECDKFRIAFLDQRQKVKELNLLLEAEQEKVTDMVQAAQGLTD